MPGETIPADWPQEVPYYKWPPFPAQPEGVTIIPFSQFVATGIPADQDEDTPCVDQMGVPTVELEARHDGEKKKRRRKKKGANGEVLEVPLSWWEEIEEDAKSSRRAYHYDHTESYFARLSQAWDDFNENRRFPPHVQAVAQNLGTCLGVSKPKLKKLKGIKTRIIDDDSDAEDKVSDDEPEPQEPDEREAPAEASIVEVQDSEIAEAEAKKRAAEEAERQRYLTAEMERERAVDEFYQDPERIIKLFLTSYAYDKGIYWSEAKLHDTPILVEAFLNFLETNSVLGPSEGSTKHGISKAKRVSELAKQEMPHTNKVARLFPDSWGKACADIWGQTTRGWVYGRLPDDPSTVTNQATETSASQTLPADPDGITSNPVTEDMIIVPTEAELQADSVEPPSINGHQMEWTRDGDGDGNGSGWGIPNAWGPGSGAESWGREGNTEDDNPTWNADEFKEPPPEDPATIWGNFGPSGREQLEALIGPNKLPETYVTLRVESSSRVIGAIVEPTPNPAGTPEGISFADIAQQRLARLTMLPSPYSNAAPSLDSCVNKPEMLNPDPDQSKFGWVANHNPLTDNITLFVQSDEPFLEVLRTGAGMTVTGLFVQVAELAPPKEDAIEESQAGTGQPPKKKKKKSKSASNVRSWWFLCQMGQVYPTFFTQ